MIHISYELLHKYNVQGPRYTSYPPAPSWSDALGPADYDAALRQSNEDPAAPLSLYVHLPFCEKLCYFCGCTTFITGKNRSFEDPYLQRLTKEVEWVADRLSDRRRVVQFHLGGGTPTYILPEKLDEFLSRLRSRFRFDAKAEVGVETDPRVTGDKHLGVLKKHGFNRISMGVQDFDPRVQKAVNRLQPFEQTRDLVAQARRLGFESVNIDLIFGLPYQNPATFGKTIEQVLEINPDRLAVYSYAHVPWLKKHQDLLAPHLPSEREKFEILLMAVKGFMEAGFEYIGMDHFARPDDELAKARRNRTLWRNFQGYTTKAGTDLIAFGMSGISNVRHAFFQNQRDTKAYEQAIDAGSGATVRGFRLGPDDKVRSRVIHNILCHAVVVKSEIEKEFGISFDAYFQDALKNLEPMRADGLVDLSPGEIRPTALGRFFLRNLAMPFDAYLPKAGETRVFSRTV